jgi:hypothetical protein
MEIQYVNKSSIHQKVDLENEVSMIPKMSNHSDVTSQEAGRVGGALGGEMVSELIKMAKKPVKVSAH